MVFLFHSRWIIVETIVNYTYNLRIFMLPIPSGIPPLSLLLCSNRSVNFVSCVSDGGMGPVNEFACKAKKVNPVICVNEVGIDPENAFVLRFNVVRVVGRAGIGPES